MCTGDGLQQKAEVQTKALEDTMKQFDEAREQLQQAKESFAAVVQQASCHGASCLPSKQSRT